MTTPSSPHSEWAHKPEDGDPEHELVPGPFRITDMPVRRPLPPIVPGKVTRGVAGATPADE